MDSVPVEVDAILHMVMHLVIPSKKVLAKGPGIFETAKLFGKRGLIFQGFELRFRKRIVIGHLGTAMALGHAQIREQERDRLRGH